MTPPWILVVEDQLIVAKSIENELQRMGYKVMDAVPSGEEAVKTALQVRPDLILMDVHLAGAMDGIEAAGIIRSKAEIPVVFLTAYSEDEIVKRAALTEPFGYLVKPFQPRELRTTIEMALYKARSEHALRESNRRYGLLFEQMVSGFALHEIITDAQGLPCDYRFLEVNPAFERLTGRRAADLIGRTVREAMPGIEAAWIERYGRVALTGEPAEFEMYAAELNRTYEVRAFSPEYGRFAVLFQDVSERRRAEGEIRRGRDFLRSVIESLTHPFLVINARDRTVVMGNAAALGSQASEGITCHRLSHGSDRPCEGAGHRCPLEEVRRTRAAVVVEHIHLQADGTARFVEVHGFPILDGDGEVARVIEYNLDITERKGTEAAMARLAKALDTTQLGVTICDLEGRILYTNPAEARMHGYAVEELLGSEARRFGLPESRRPLDPTQGGGMARESVNLRRDGTRFPVNLVTDIVMTAEGAPAAYVTICEDITERKAIGIRLARLQTAIEQMAESVVITDPAGRIEYVNPAFTFVTGFSREEVLGQNPRILKSGTHPPDFYADLWATLSAGGTWQGIFRNRRKDGSLFEEEASISPFRDAQGANAGYVAVKRDVTAEHRMERRLQEQERLASIGELAGAIAHEIKNPLFAITGGLQVLEMEVPMGPEQRQYLKTIIGEGMRIDRLIRQLRASSRPVQLDRRPVALADIVGAAVLAMKGPAQQKGVGIFLNAPPSLPSLTADRDKLTQVFVNLLQNALEASAAETAIRVDLTAGRETFKVTVTDQGVGIRPEVLGRIFDPLFTTKVGNTGLGLYISRTIVLQHGGDIVAEPQADGGARFTVTLPFEDDHAG